MPVAVPPDVGGPAAALQKVPDAEDGFDERPTPREGRHEGGGLALTFKVLTQLPEMCVDAGDALLSQDRRDDQGVDTCVPRCSPSVMGSLTILSLTWCLDPFCNVLHPQMSRWTFKTTRDPNGSMLMGSSFMWANCSRTAR